MSLNPHLIRADFPILGRLVHDQKPLIYLDNAATSQKPRQVIDAISEYYMTHNANVHRGVHQLSDESTKDFHQSRKQIAQFFGALPEELIIVRNTTEAINQVAYTWGESSLQQGDIVVTSEMEHHSNIVPWQQVTKRRGAELMYMLVDETGKIDLTHLTELLKKHGSHVKLVVFTHISNTLGTLNPVAAIIADVKKHAPHAKILIDGAQAAPHIPIDFHALGVDFYTVSAHKMLGPMGIGGLLIKKSVIEQMQPFLTGGGMISEVRQQDTQFTEDLEELFTAGTPDVAGLVGWASACSYLENLTMNSVKEHDQVLVNYALEKFSELTEVHLIGPLGASTRVGSVAFIYDGVHAHDVSQILDYEGVAVRSGHHCTMPLHQKFGWQATVRVSFQIYNTKEDIDACVQALKKVKTVFGK